MRTGACRRIFLRTVNHFHTKDVPTIKHIQNNNTNLTKAVVLHPYKIQMYKPLKRGESCGGRISQTTWSRNPPLKARYGSEMRPIFSWMVTWINKTDAIEVRKILMSKSSRHHIHKGWRYGVSCKIQIINSIFIDGMITGVKYRELLEQNRAVSTWEAGSDSCKMGSPCNC